MDLSVRLDLARTAFDQGDLTVAHLNCTEIRTYSGEDETFFFATFQLAQCEFLIGNIDQGISLLYEVLSKAWRLRTPVFKGWANALLGVGFTRLQDFARAHQFYADSLIAYPAAGGERDVVAMYRGWTYLKSGDFSAAQYHLGDAYHSFQLLEMEVHAADAARLLGESLLLAGELNRAQSLLQEAIDVYHQSETDPRLGLIHAQAMLALCEARLRNLSETHRLFEEVNQLIETSRIPPEARPLLLADIRFDEILGHLNT